MKKKIYLQSKPETERAKIDSAIADKFGIEFLSNHRSCPLSVLEKLSNENKSKSPKYEYLILNELRRRGLNVLHQHPILYRYIPDMIHFSFRDNVVIEIDGPSHEGRRYQDRERSMILEAFRFEVMRFDAPKLSKHYGMICTQIEKRLKPYKQSKPLMALERPNRLYPNGVEHTLFQQQLDLAQRLKKNRL